MNRALFAIGLVFSLAMPALAGTTTVLAPPVNGGEYNIEQILESHYGGDFIVDGLDFINGGAGGNIAVTRWDDFLAPMNELSVANPALGSEADQFWRDGNFSASAVARFSSASQQIGFDRGNGFELLFDVAGVGMAATGSNTVDLTNDTWRWVRRSAEGDTTYYSQEAANSDGMDHMVTYRVTGLDNGAAGWLLCFEDFPGELPDFDRDFNDMVVELETVPEPVTCTLLAAGGIALWAGRKRR